MMSTTALKPATTPIPVQLSETEFTAFILPHLSMPKRGPKCKLGYHRVFNFILWVLYTGMQWKCLPIPQGEHSVFLTFLVAAVGTVQTPDPRYRYTWHSAVLTCDHCSPHTTTHRSA